MHVVRISGSTVFCSIPKALPAERGGSRCSSCMSTSQGIPARCVRDYRFTFNRVSTSFFAASSSLPLAGGSSSTPWWLRETRLRKTRASRCGRTFGAASIAALLLHPEHGSRGLRARPERTAARLPVPIWRQPVVRGTRTHADPHGRAQGQASSRDEPRPPLGRFHLPNLKFGSPG